MSDEVYTWAVYDEYDVKLRGGFPTSEHAKAWFANNPPYIVTNTAGEELARTATAYEADLIRIEHPTVLIYPASFIEYRILLET